LDNYFFGGVVYLFVLHQFGAQAAGLLKLN